MQHDGKAGSDGASQVTGWHVIPHGFSYECLRYSYPNANPALIINRIST